MAAVNPAVDQAVTSGRFKNLFSQSTISAMISNKLQQQPNGRALKAMGPNEDNVTKRDRNLMGNPPQFAVGHRNKEYPDYRKVTAAEWKNPTFQAQLVEAHQEGGGWALLEEPFECNDTLCVAEGWVTIDGALVAEVGSDPYGPHQQIRGVYPAMNTKTNVAWTTTLPALGNNWTARAYSQSRAPCLFVHESYNPAPGGGSRRSRRHKRRNYIKKQKKRTRKH